VGGVGVVCAVHDQVVLSTQAVGDRRCKLFRFVTTCPLLAWACCSHAGVRVGGRGLGL
jgi:hypothetical protein